MAETEEPPAYDPEADANDGDNETATTQKESKPKKEKVPDEPPPDGEGELGRPLLRVYFIGGSLAIWGILAFWMVVFWLASAVDYCRFQARTLTCYVSDDDDCLDSAYASCEAAYDDDTLTENIHEGYATDYVASSWEFRLTAWTILTVAIGVGFFGAVASYFAVKKGNACYTKIAYIMVGLGGFLTAAGGLIYIISWDSDALEDYGDYEDFINAIHAAQFGEFFIVGVIGIIFAMDLKNLLLNDEEKRLMYLTVPFAVIGLYLGVDYAYIINWEPDADCYKFFLYDPIACISAGYFIIGIMCIVRLLVAKEKISLGDNPAKATLYEFIISLLIVLGGFICAVGYWATIDKTFDLDTECIVCNGASSCGEAYHYVGILTYLYGDSAQPGLLGGTVSISGGGYTVPDSIPDSLVDQYISWYGDSSTSSFGVSGSYDVKYESQFKAFYCGYSFFIFGLTLAIAYDMNIMGNYKKVRAAQSAASD